MAGAFDSVGPATVGADLLSADAKLDIFQRQKKAVESGSIDPTDTVQNFAGTAPGEYSKADPTGFVGTADTTGGGATSGGGSGGGGGGGLPGGLMLAAAGLVLLALLG